tara:strand:+ start:3045 stop:4235 length:1191 start_codon:yes stop_codon:yes gene_type:complete
MGLVYMRAKANNLLQSLFILLGITIPVSVFATNILLGLIICLWLFEGNIRFKIKSIFSEKWIVFLFVFFCWNILGMIWGDNHNSSVWIFQRLALLLLFPILITVNFSKKVIKKSIIVLLTTLACVSFIAILQDLNYIKHISKYVSFVNSRNVVFTTYNYHNIILAFGFLLSFLYFNNKKNILWVHILIICLYFTSIFLEAGRAGQLLIICYSIYYIIYFNKNNFLRLVLFLFSFLLIQVLAYNISNTYKQRLDTTYYRIINIDKKEIQQKETRFVLASWTIKRLIQKPIFGYGTGSFKYNFDKDQILKEKYARHMTPHNNYLFVLYELGLIGFFLLIMIFYYKIKSLYNTKFKHQKILLPISFLVLMTIDSYLYVFSIVALYIYIYTIFINYNVTD